MSSMHRAVVISSINSSDKCSHACFLGDFRGGSSIPGKGAYCAQGRRGGGGGGGVTREQASQLFIDHAKESIFRRRGTEWEICYLALL